MKVELVKKAVEIIVISWEKIPFEGDFTSKFSHEWDKGIYQIYGNHYAYGDETLLYIGKAEDQTFAQRLLNDDRLNDLRESTAFPTSIRLGWIVKSNKDKDNLEMDKLRSQYIDVAEKLLIASHTPAYNSQLSYRLGQIGKMFNGQDYLILNLEDKGALLPEVSTFRNSYQYYEYETPLGKG